LIEIRLSGVDTEYDVEEAEEDVGSVELGNWGGEVHDLQDVEVGAVEDC
jgi:hypothetical protein